MKKALIIALIGIVLMSFTQAVKKQLWYTKSGKVEFFSSTPIEDIKAVNNQVQVIFDQDAGTISAKVNIKSFLFKKKLMQEHFNENYMESDKYPYASYKGKIIGLENIDFALDSNGNFKNPGTYNVFTKGKLTMHGVTKDVITSTENGTIKLSGSKATIKAQFEVLLEDYNIKKPSVVAMKIADKIKITLESACKKK